MSKVHKKVRFKGEEYWLNESDAVPGMANLSPLSHYNEAGEMLANPFRDISYAVVMDGEILRFGEQIGVASDLEDVEDETERPAINAE